MAVNFLTSSPANEGGYYAHMFCPAYGGILMLVFWVLVVAGSIFAVQYLLRRSQEDGNRPSLRDGRALEILKERYARGEIDKLEFEEKKRDLLS